MRIPFTLARARASRISALACDLHLSISADPRDPVAGRATIAFDLNDASRPLSFDFDQPRAHLERVVANGTGIDPVWEEDDHPSVLPQHLARGRNEVAFRFTAGGGAFHRQDDLLYSLFVPARACRAFPCFDQPDLKVRWRLTVDVPPGWTAVSNAPELSRRDSLGCTTIAFEPTVPLPTYLLAIVAGRLSREVRTSGQRTFGIFHVETGEDENSRLRRNLDAVIDLHARALDWLEEYTDIPYPFPKFDITLIPSFEFSGMEHPGVVYYDAGAVVLEDTATTTQVLTRANLIAHETAHMWFGDLVTMPWFDDVWLKEVFANHFASKIVDPWFPAIDHDARFFLQHYRRAYDLDRTPGATAIRPELTDLGDAGGVYGAAIYHKAPIVMRHLEGLIGERALQDALRSYLRTYAFGNASWPDLLTLLSARAGHDLGTWSEAWLRTPGRPTIATDLRIAKGRVEELRLRQVDPRGRGVHWPQRLGVSIGLADGVTHRDVLLDSETVIVPDLRGLEAPRWVLPGGDGIGYARFEIDEATLEYLGTSIGTLTDPITCGAALDALWDALSSGRLSAERLLRTLVSTLRDVGEDLLVQRVLDDARTVFWKFLGADQREAAAELLEPVLLGRLSSVDSPGVAAAWFRTLRCVATRPGTVAWLERIWRREVVVAGQPLSETDETDVACELAVRGVRDPEGILTAQHERLAAPDRRARFAFVRPALSGSSSVRDRCFDDLLEAIGHKPEPWIIDAMRWLRHPLRGDASRKYIGPALARVQRIHAAGDIFFPRRWIDATLDASPPEAAARDVETFLASVGSGYPAHLRLLLLTHTQGSRGS